MLKKFTAITSVIFLLILLIGCGGTTEKEITSINVINIPDQIEIGKFDYAGINFEIAYSDGTYTKEDVTEDKIPTEYKHYLYEEGTHSFSFLYRGFDVSFEITMYDNMYDITFININNEEVLTVSYKPNATITYPSEEEMYVEGYRFLGTYDNDLTNITSDLTVKGNYVKVWTVKFYNGLNELISIQIVDDNTHAKEPTEEEREIDGYKFIAWDTTFTNVTSDLNIYGVYELIEVECNHNIIQATCTQASYCDICKEEFELPLDHNLIHHEAKESTCTEHGHNAYDTCTRCPYTTYIELPLIAHTYVSVVTNPTCTLQGYTTHTCSMCKHTYVDTYVKETGHTPSNWIIDKEPTCTEQGSKYQECTVCKETLQQKIINANGHEYQNNVCTICGHEKEDTPIYSINEDKTEVTFGSYPQSLVTDDAVKAALDSKIGLLPTSTNNYDWTSYGYYISSSNDTNFMWYQDITLDNNKYRAVYFTSYRPYCTSYSSSTSNTYQNDNGYYRSTVYYFRFDPIIWKVLELDETNNKAFLFANIALDAQDYFYNTLTRTIDEKKVYQNNYEYSTIRNWLNDNFYNTAFTKEEQQIILDTLVDNSASSTGYTTNSYACNDTIDKIFLLSYSDVVNSKYGFSSNISRQLKSTDYAKAQGCHTLTSTSSLGNCRWWLRSPSCDFPYDALCVYYDGRVNSSGSVDSSSVGVVPALWISIEDEEEQDDTPIYSINEDKTEVTFGSYPQSLVTDDAVKATLDSKIGLLPTSINNYDWTSYGYYISSSNDTNFMWYQDITLDNNKYRAVYFTSYRLFYTDYSSNTYQDDNGYYTSTVYYFRFDPIIWKVLELDETNNKVFLFANIALDAQDYFYDTLTRTIDEKKVYQNNYEYSTIRSWLNDNFYNTAFTKEEQQIILDTLVDNSASSTGYTTNQYACNDTIDKIFLLSYSDVVNSKYVFSSIYYEYDISRQIKSTDYAKAQGCHTSTSTSYLGNCLWWLRSPYDDISDHARCVYFDGFVGYVINVHSTNLGVVPALWISIEDEEEQEDTPIYSINEDKTEVTFGSYPQSLVTDDAVKAALDSKIGLLPTSTNNYDWTSYGYYISSSNDTNFMWYQDITLDNNKYRAVYFTSYRPYCTSYSSSTSNTYQNDNGYYRSTVYYFRFDPIIWKVLELDETNNKAFLFANIALDAQDYFYDYNLKRTIDEKKVYPNNYEYSTIRSWLNDNFYNTAFTKEEQQIILDTLVDNSASSTGYTTNQYACNDTIDKIFLLSYSDVVNNKYGFSSYISRQLKSTDYAKAQGCYTPTSTSYLGNFIWWLRSPVDYYKGARYVDNDGYVSYSNYVYGTAVGVVPALWISI